MKTCLAVLLCLTLAGSASSHPDLQPRPPEEKHFMLREYPDMKGLYEISFKDMTLTECMSEAWKHAGTNSIGIVPADKKTGRYLNNIELFMIGQDLANQFDRFYHVHGDITALVDDRLKPLMAERLKESDIDQYGGEGRLYIIKDSEANQLAASLTAEQLEMNRSGGIPIDKLSDEQRKRVEILTQYRQVIDPFDTRTVDSLDSARVILHLVPKLRFRNVVGYPDVTGWAIDNSKSAVSSKELKTRGMSAPVEHSLPDPKFVEEITVAESAVSLRELLRLISRQTGASISAEAEYNSLKLSAYCKVRAVDVLSAISDVTGLGWDKKGSRWMLCANEKARSTAEWRIKHLWVRPFAAEIKSGWRRAICSFVADSKLPLWVDDPWLSDGRLYSLVNNLAEIGYEDLTDAEKGWMTKQMRDCADIFQFDEAKLLQDMTQWRYTFAPSVRLRISNDRGILYSDWLSLE